MQEFNRKFQLFFMNIFYLVIARDARPLILFESNKILLCDLPNKQTCHQIYKTKRHPA